MITSSVVNGALPFRIKRPLVSGFAAVPTLDPEVTACLTELEALLSRRVFVAPVVAGPGAAVAAPPAGPGAPPGAAAGAAGAGAAAAKAAGAGGGAPAKTPLDLTVLLASPLTPRRTNLPRWATNSVADRLSKATDDNSWHTLSEIADVTPDLSELKYAVAESLAEDWLNLTPTAQAVLDASRPATRDFLLLIAFRRMGLRDVNAVKNALVSGRAGVRSIADYVAISAARMIVEDEKLDVDDANSDGGQLAKDIRAAALPLNRPLFRARLDAIVDNLLFNSDELKLIEQANIGTIPPELKPQLVQYIKQSPVPIDKNNVKFFLPLFISQIKGGIELEQRPAPDAADADRDFDVTFLTDDEATAVVDRSAVKCAAQLYYTMTLGDELGIFDVVNYFTHHYLVRRTFTIEDPRLRQDLKQYVFSNEFTMTDPRTGLKQTADRSRPAERQMFYRQVFNLGAGPGPDADIVANDEFPRLWKMLMLESANYLQRAQLSPNPTSFVSKQNVMQAVEDLLYNLSAHCTGMANVISPLISAEFTFVTRRILAHPEVIRAVVPGGGSIWKVVENLAMEQRRARPRATVFNNKATYGHQIIRAIAGYDAATFDAEPNFSQFISTVDAYISTQSILQEGLVDDLKGADGTEPDDQVAAGGVALPGNAPQTTDEWDF
ncbi:hypothetical protein [Couchioplanes azureus]|uniref:hypothetical protein n=1 Tax=Couchioplanes caeruleus TaxID=56438 RepID=UPI0016712497|nr:hypothetical protein [Couchioplanes caeruleus]GGQ70048.1 hypothetical protein GCM10010166_44850 [Couchioplanes caeruleus subsp. azureus]